MQLWFGQSLAPVNASHPLPGLLGLVMAPMTASVASVALSGSDSNQRFRIWNTWGESDRTHLLNDIKSSVNCYKPWWWVQLLFHKNLAGSRRVLGLDIEKTRTSIYKLSVRFFLKQWNIFKRRSHFQRTTFDERLQCFGSGQSLPQRSARDTGNIDGGGIQERVDRSS